MNDKSAPPKVDSISIEKYEALQAAFAEFVYIVSHDLNAPLRHIRAFSQLLLERLSEHIGPEEQRFVNIISNSVEKAEDMLASMLALSRVDTADAPFERVDCNALLSDIVQHKLAALIKEKKAEVAIGELPVIHANSAQLTQLFSALIHNALHFQPEGQTPIISLEATSLDAGQWQFTLRDNGIGIEEEFCGQIFRIFRRLNADKEYAGLGMGLTIARAIVERHNGRIWCEAQQGAGTTFKVVL